MSKPLPEIVYVRWEGKNPAFIEAYHATNRPDEFTQYTRSDIVEKLRGGSEVEHLAAWAVSLRAENAELKKSLQLADGLLDGYKILIKDTE